MHVVTGLADLRHRPDLVVAAVCLQHGSHPEPAPNEAETAEQRRERA